MTKIAVLTQKEESRARLCITTEGSEQPVTYIIHAFSAEGAHADSLDVEANPACDPCVLASEA